MEDRKGIDTKNLSTYINHYRDIPQWLKQSPKTFHLLSEFARRARRIKGDVGWNGETIHLEVKQFITGRLKVSQELGLTEGEYRSAYAKLVRYGLIKTVITTKRYTIGEYCADSVFNLNIPEEQPTEQPSELPTGGQQTTTNNNENNGKNVKSRLVEDEDSEESSPYKRKKDWVTGRALFDKKRKELGI